MAGSTPRARKSPSVIRAPASRSTWAMSSAAHAGCSSTSSGLQRLHGRYPATMAALGVAKYSTFLGSGLRAGQVGRQKMPVVRTPKKNRPLYEASRSRYARCISSIGGSVLMLEV